MRLHWDTGLRRAWRTILAALALLIAFGGTPATTLAQGFEYTVDDDHKFKLSFVSRGRLEGWNAHAGSMRYFHALRSRATLNYAYKDSVRALLQFQDVRLHGLNGPNSGTGALGLFRRFSSKSRPPSPAGWGSSNTSNQALRQAWIEFDAALEGMSFRVGRQDVKLATEVLYPEANWRYLKIARTSQRLVGTVGWTHGERSNNAISASYDMGKHHLFIFGGEPTKGVFDIDGAYGRQKDIQYGGFSWTAKRGTWIDDTEVRLFGIYYDDERNPNDGGLSSSKDLELFTGGFSVLGVQKRGDGNFDYLLWGAYQWGDMPCGSAAGCSVASTELSHKAWAAIGELGYQYTERAWKPWIRGGINIASGDGSPTDSDSEGFFNILPTNHLYYGFADRFAFSNLIDYFAQLKLKPGENTGINLMVHHFTLLTSDDAYVRGTGAFNRDVFGYVYTSSRGHRGLGTEIDLVVDYKLNKNLAIQAGYAYMFGHAVFNSAPFSEDDVKFGYLQLTGKY